MFPSQQNGQSTAYALRNWQGKQTFAKGNEKKKKSKKLKKKSKSKSLLMTSHNLKVASIWLQSMKLATVLK